jgi:hypothetical protein
VHLYLILSIFTTVGIWGVGLATHDCDLNAVPQGHDTNSWVLRSDGTVCHNNEVLHRVDPVPADGDTVVRLNHK